MLDDIEILLTSILSGDFIKGQKLTNFYTHYCYGDDFIFEIAHSSIHLYFFYYD